MTEPTAGDAPVPTRPALLTVLRKRGTIGCIGFGGPQHISSCCANSACNAGTG